MAAVDGWSIASNSWRWTPLLGGRASRAKMRLLQRHRSSLQLARRNWGGPAFSSTIRKQRFSRQRGFSGRSEIKTPLIFSHPAFRSAFSCRRVIASSAVRALSQFDVGNMGEGVRHSFCARTKPISQPGKPGEPARWKGASSAQISRNANPCNNLTRVAAARRRAGAGWLVLGSVWES